MAGQAIQRIQAWDSPTGVMHSWICYSESRKKLAGNVVLSGRLGCSNCETVKLKILLGTEEGKYQSTDLGL